MSSRQLIDFIEAKFAEHNVTKLIPPGDIIPQHARRLVEQHLTKEALEGMRDELARKAAAHRLPRDLGGKVRKLLAEQPALPWDAAVALALGLGGEDLS